MIFSLKKKDLNLILKALKFTNPYRIKFLIAIICAVIGIILELTQPVLWGSLITKLFYKDYNIILKLIFGLVLVYILQSIFDFIKLYIFSYLNENIILDLRKTVYDKIINLSLTNFNKMGAGVFMSYLNEDISSIASLFTNELLNTVIDILKVIFIGIFIFCISPILSIIIVISFPITYIVFNISGKILRGKNSQARKIYDNYFKFIQESILAIKEIKSLGIKKHNIQKFSVKSSKIKDLNIKMGVVSSISSNICVMVNFLSQIIIYTVGSYFVIHGKLLMQYFISFTSYSQQFSNALTNMTRINSNIQKGSVSIERIFKLFDELEYLHDEFGNLNIKEICGNIEFKNVKFKYNDKETIKGISFNIIENRKYAIVGKSGAGKSTIFNLLLRFYNINSGEIKIDDININEFTEDSFRKHIAIVGQETFLFNLSIKDNLLLANQTASLEEIINACEIADIHDYIMSLPNAYDYVIAENGNNLSVGQKQRISIARAILKKSKIILFDEATCSLDNECKFKIKNSINKLAANHTIIVITHKILDIINCDSIFVINDGEIVGQGQHEFLIKNNDLYKNLYLKEINS